MSDTMSASAPREVPPSLLAAHHEQVAVVTASALAARGAWGEYLRKVLPPVVPTDAIRLIRATRI
jgi:hypothetical protein